MASFMAGGSFGELGVDPLEYCSPTRSWRMDDDGTMVRDDVRYVDVNLKGF